jgi:hypothetical protein
MRHTQVRRRERREAERGDTEFINATALELPLITVVTHRCAHALPVRFYIIDLLPKSIDAKPVDRSALHGVRKRTYSLLLRTDALTRYQYGYTSSIFYRNR